MAVLRYTLVLRIIAAMFLIGYGHPLNSFPIRFQSGQTYRYNYETEIKVNEQINEQTSNAKKDVGIKFSAEVEVTAVWSNTYNLIKLLIVSPRLHGVAQLDMKRELEILPKLPVYFQWEAGRVGQIFVGDDDTILASNIKKGIVSLFQLHLEDGKHSEIDASGECAVVYQRIDSKKMIKTKSNCNNMDSQGQFTQVNELLRVNVTSSMRMEFTVSDDIIKSVIAHEKWMAHLNLELSLSSIISAKQKLVLKETVTSPLLHSDSFEGLLKVLEAERGHNLQRMLLGTVFESKPCTVGCVSAQNIIEKHKYNFHSDKTGKVAAALAFRDVFKTVHGLPKEDILAILKNELNKDKIMLLIDIISAVQTPAAQSALMEFLNFNAEHKIERQERYLLATALSTHPHEQTLRDLLELFEKNVRNEMLRESIAETLGAVTNTFFRTKGQANHKIVVEVQSALLNRLKSCDDSLCSLTIIRSLANAGLPATLDVLLSYSETSKDGSVSEAALRALRRIDRKLITNEIRDRLKNIFHEKKRGYDTSVRSQALTILLETGPTLEEMHDIIMESTDPWNTDYDMYIQARVFNLMRHDETVRSMVKKILSDSKLNNYHVLAPKGKALAFTSYLGDQPNVTYFMYVENSRSGIMKRSGMDIDILSPIQKLPIYSFGIFAAGLEGLIGDEEVEAEEAETEVTAGMALDMVGVSLRPITFFTGKGGLMSAIWSAPTELVSAFQTNILLQDDRQRIHLQNGLIAELNHQGILSLDLSGQLVVSLWNKNSKSLIKNRGTLLIVGSLSVTTSSFRTGIDFSAEAESFIDFQTDADFYDGVKMCLQMSRPDIHFKRNVTKYESVRGFKKTFVSKINRSTLINSISYPLPGRNAENCRLINPDKI